MIKQMSLSFKKSNDSDSKVTKNELLKVTLNFELSNSFLSKIF